MIKRPGERGDYQTPGSYDAKDQETLPGENQTLRAVMGEAEEGGVN
jgi:hypothetical protein